MDGGAGMEKIEKIYLKEEDASLGFLCPEYAEVTGELLCNVCMSWNGPGKCKILGISPDEYRWVDKRDCPHAVLDTNAIGIQIFTKLYPEDTERLLKKQKQSFYALILMKLFTNI